MSWFSLLALSCVGFFGEERRLFTVDFEEAFGQRFEKKL
jgi:hypothetical protein